MNTTPQCKTCLYWLDAKENGNGECHHSPPQSVLVPMPMATDGKDLQRIQPMKRPGVPMPTPPSGQRFGPVAFWPPTKAHQWCGEYELRPQPHTIEPKEGE